MASKARQWRNGPFSFSDMFSLFRSRSLVSFTVLDGDCSTSLIFAEEEDQALDVSDSILKDGNYTCYTVETTALAAAPGQNAPAAEPEQIPAPAQQPTEKVAPIIPPPIMQPPGQLAAIRPAPIRPPTHIRPPNSKKPPKVTQRGRHQLS
ncbi:hypothetical protein HN51_043613 [Arachis hypogaea]